MNSGAMTARRARAVLGLSAGATASDVRHAWRRTAKAAHPDGGGDPARFREAVEAYRVLRETPPPPPPRAIRRDDLWLTVKVEPRVLTGGGRLELDTPLGRRTVWISRKAGARGLVRLPGQDLFIRLEAQVPPDGPARSRLRQFAAAWAA